MLRLLVPDRGYKLDHLRTSAPGVNGWQRMAAGLEMRGLVLTDRLPSELRVNTGNTARPTTFYKTSTHERH